MSQIIILAAPWFWLAGIGLLVMACQASSARAWPICMMGLCLIAIPFTPAIPGDERIGVGVAVGLVLVFITLLVTLPRSNREEDEAEMQSLEESSEDAVCATIKPCSRL